MINVYLLNIQYSGTFSGVDRHIELLMYGLSKISGIRLYYLKFLVNSKEIFIDKDISTFGEIWTMPYPYEEQKYIFNDEYSDCFYGYVTRILSDVFQRKRNRILYVHTLNLIKFAEVVNRTYKSKILTHLHCIPWRQKINSNLIDFMYISRHGANKPHNMICSDVEWRSYQKAQHIVCVSNSGKEFLRSIGVNTPITVVYNGLDLESNETVKEYDYRKKEKLNLIFVGDTNRGKGIELVVQALNKLHGRCTPKLILHLAGNVDEGYLYKLRDQYPYVNMINHGIICWRELQDLYRQSQIGVIGSLQEQCSYTAIEMMMVGLPIVTTSADGLAEMFTHEENALVCPIIKEDCGMLRFDTNIFAQYINRIITNPRICKKLSIKARQRAQLQFDVKTMITQIKDILHEIT